MRIALDAMGGDLGVSAVIDGVRRSTEFFPDVDFLLVGDENAIKQAVTDAGWTLPKRVTIRHASEVLEMQDTLADIRKKRDSSVSGAVNAVKKGDADVCVAVGNTLAAVAVSTFTYGRIKGIKQPGIIVQMPSLNEIGSCMMIDMGANVNPIPEHLFLYGAMANEYVKHAFDLSSPRIGLLSVGEEDTKGSAISKKVFELLSKGNFNFAGNVEGGDFILGNVDIIVCDGFTGNAVLKSAEHTASTILKMIRDGVNNSILAKIGALFMKKVFMNIKKKLDWREHAGGLLLGVKGLTIISHGRADGYAIFNSITTARKLVQSNVLKHIEDAVARAKSLMASGTASAEFEVGSR